MSLSNTTAQVGPYTIASFPATLAVSFPFAIGTDLLVQSLGTSLTPNDPPVTLTYNSDYTVTGGGFNSANAMLTGSVVCVGTGAHLVEVGERIVITLATPETQLTSFQLTGLLTVPMIERAFDKLTNITKTISEGLKRTLRVPASTTSLNEIDTSPFKSMVLGFDANMQPTPYAPTPGAAMPVATSSTVGSVKPDNSTTIVSASGVLSAPSGTRIASVADLKLVDYSAFPDNTPIELLGYYAAGDGGGQKLYIDKADTTTADDGVFTFVASDGTRIKAVDTSSVTLWQAGAFSSSSDCTARAQAALNACKSVIIPPGVFIVDGLTGGLSGQTISGVGTLKLKAASAADEIVNVNAKTDIVIHGVTFDGNNGAHGAWTEARDCVKITSCQRVLFDGVTFKGITNDGIYIQSVTTATTDVKVLGCHFYGANDNRNGISIIYAKRVSITGCQFTGMSRSNMPGAIDLEPNLNYEIVEDVAISGNTFTDCRTAVLGYNGVTATCRNISVGINTVTTPTLNHSANYGYYFDGFTNVSISGGVIDDVYNSAWFDNCAVVSISGLTVTNWTAGGFGIKFEDGNTDCHAIYQAKGPDGNYISIVAGAEVVHAVQVDGSWRFGATSLVSYWDMGLRPAYDQSHALGAPTYRWGNLYVDDGFLASLVLSSLPTYADNAAAVTAGWPVNKLYKTSTGQVMIRY